MGEGNGIISFHDISPDPLLVKGAEIEETHNDGNRTRPFIHPLICNKQITSTFINSLRVQSNGNLLMLKNSMGLLLTFSWTPDLIHHFSGVVGIPWYDVKILQSTSSADKNTGTDKWLQNNIFLAGIFLILKYLFPMCKMGLGSSTALDEFWWRFQI